MRFLNNEESWNLLQQNVFAEKSFPPQLEKVGRKIAEKCEGLPLLILAVSSILCGLEKTEEYWKKVADKKTTTFTDAYDKISKVLSSSYKYLPQHLKACFLYMGVFPKLIHLWSVEDILEKNYLLKPKAFPTRVVRTSKKIYLAKTCSVVSVRPLERLHLLEPGPSLTRVIRPLEKFDFLKPKPSPSRVTKTPNKFGMECLEKLVSNSLAIACKQSSSYSIKSSKLHSAYWHVCVKEARKNKFFHVLKKLTDGSKDYMESQRRLSVQNNILFGMKNVYDSMAATLTARSLLCTGPDHEYPVPICLDLMLLKVLDALAIRFYEFPTEVVKLLQLRYLALTHNGKLPSSISKLQQLECLILRQHHNIKLLRDSRHRKWYVSNRREVRDSTSLPKEIWDMPKLRHLQIMGSNLPDPSNGALLPNLLTLHVNAHCCTEAVFRSTPNLEKLRIKIELQPNTHETLICFLHIGLLRGLESLKCVIVNPHPHFFASFYDLFNFPRGLKKLSLNGLRYFWEDMNAIGWLPNLKELKLRCSAFQGREWKTRRGEFQSLEFLLLEDINLVHWTDDGGCFRRLRRLIIRHCYKLKLIPQRIGAIPTLETMEVVDCSPSVVASTHQIQENRKFSLQVVINSSWNL